MELKRLLMCLVLLYNLDSFAKAIAPVLSQKIFIGPDALGMTPRSDMNYFIQTPSFAASEAAMYSASHVDTVMTLCLELHQLTAPPFNKKYVSGLWLRVIRISVKASIDVTIYDKLFVTSMNEKHILGPFQVLQDILDRYPVIHSWITFVPPCQTYGKAHIRSGTQHSTHDRTY